MQYLGPNAYQLAHLLILVAVNSLTLFMLFIVLIRAIYALSTNITSIEDWTLERHEVLLKRARKNGGFVWGDNGIRLTIVKHEFPYDIGIWRNIVQGMGTSNVRLLNLIQPLITHDVSRS